MPATRLKKPPQARRPAPEHRDDEGREQRRVEDREQRLDVVHDVRVALGDERREHRDQNPDDRHDPARAQIERGVAVLGEVGLDQVVGHHRVERGHVRGHAGHERGEQSGHRESQHPLGQVVADQVRDRGVVLLAEARADPSPFTVTTAIRPGRMMIAGQEDLRVGADQRRAARGRHVAWPTARAAPRRSSSSSSRS